jgi:hypothetical protein
MWLIVTAISALAVTAVYVAASERYRLGMLSVVLWTLAICIFVDHTIGWLMDGGEYFEIGAEQFMLSIAMLIPIFAAWELFMIKDKFAPAKAAAKVTEQVV